MTPTNDAAAERVRELTATDAMFANFMADSSFDSAEEMQRFIKWFDEPGRIPSGWDVTRYARAQMALAYAELAAQLAEAEQQLQKAREACDIAFHVICNAIKHGMPITKNVADARNMTAEVYREWQAALGIKGAT